MRGLSDAERADIRRRFDDGERAICEHDPGECDVCDEFRRLDLKELTVTDGPLTHDEVMRVHRHECLRRGHSWSPLQQFGWEDPVAIICSHCGRRCAVQAAPR